MDRNEKLAMLLEQLKRVAADTKQQASYEDDYRHKAWLEGRASAYANVRDWLGKVLA